MKTQTKEFLTKLAALLQEYSVELTVEESCRSYGGFSVDGLEIGVKNYVEEYDYWNMDYVQLYGTMYDAGDVLELLDKES